LLALLSISAFAQGTFTDSRDGKKYKTAKIGKQTWMAQNLDYHGEDGYLGLCYGDKPKEKIRKPDNCKKYGRLYDWDEAMKACPRSWHLPSDAEWQTLVDFAGGNEVAGQKLKSKSGWEERKCKYTEEEIDERGRITVVKHDYCTTDEFGFSAPPGGGGYSGGRFNGVGHVGFWWSATEDGSSGAYYRIMVYDSRRVHRRNHYNIKSDLYSVRCVQD
jgi:uncharacterized protein (TIGR02145 family)